VEAIPRLLSMIEEGWDLVNATRLDRRPKAMPLSNYIANRIFAWTAGLLHGIKTSDVHSGMRAYRKSMIDRVDWDPNGPALPVDMLIIPYRMGFKVLEVPIEYRERIGASSLQRWKSTLWTFKRLWKARKIGQ
jgi:hypothetical protein